MEAGLKADERRVTRKEMGDEAETRARERARESSPPPKLVRVWRRDEVYSQREVPLL